MGITILNKIIERIIGEGPAREALEQGAREHGLEARVHFAGTRPHDRIPSLLPAFDVVYCPGPLHPHHFWEADLDEGSAEPESEEPDEIEEVRIDDDFAPKLPDD